MATTYIAMGTNLGERLSNLQMALERLASGVTIERTSSIYETEPWGLADQPRFLNLVLKGETKLDSSALLEFLKSIEREMGRVATVRYGPRLIDLDILFYNNEILDSAALTIPHPRLAERGFVLIPLAEIAPDLVHPLLRVKIGELLKQLPDDRSVWLYKPRVQ